MNKPDYSSSIEEKIRWLEWFQNKREINDLDTLSKFCNINVLFQNSPLTEVLKTNKSSLESIKTRNTKILSVTLSQLNKIKSYAKLDQENTRTIIS